MLAPQPPVVSTTNLATRARKASFVLAGILPLFRSQRRHGYCSMVPGERCRCGSSFLAQPASVPTHIVGQVWCGQCTATVRVQCAAGCGRSTARVRDSLLRFNAEGSCQIARVCGSCIAVQVSAWGNSVHATKCPRLTLPAGATAMWLLLQCESRLTSAEAPTHFERWATHAW